jgi:hypothetical protein
VTTAVPSAKGQHSCNGEAPLPACWTEYFDEAHGAKYYYNEKTDISQWTRPVAIVSTFSKVNACGRSNPAELIQDATCRQSPLPTGWTEQLDDNTGVSYYWNERTYVSQWDRPVASSEAPAAKEQASDDSHDDGYDEIMRHQTQQKVAGEWSEVYYYQVEDFRTEERRNKKGKKKHVVKLVRIDSNEIVHMFLSPKKPALPDPLHPTFKAKFPSAIFQQPFKEDMKEKCDKNGDTYATHKYVNVSENGDEISEEEKKRVHFMDGRGTLYSGENNATSGENNTTSTWTYIDRNMSGFSLYEYAPNDKEYAAFASSRFGQLHLKEAKEIEGTNEQHQQDCLRDADWNDTYNEEEQHLNKLLIDAGVRPYQLR